MGLSSNIMLTVAEQHGLATISEVFADRHALLMVHLCLVLVMMQWLRTMRRAISPSVTNGA